VASSQREQDEEDRRVTENTLADRLKEGRIVRYFRKTLAELRKVAWPSRQEALRLTGIVLAVTFAMAAFLGFIDYLLSLGFGLFIK
jgi:preprotein translocase subunit SecE